MYHKFKMLFLILGTMTLLFTCQKDDFTEHFQTSESPKQPPFKISKVDKTKISENRALLGKLNKLQETPKGKKGSAQERTTYSSEHDFFINTDHATYIESQDGSYHSYTFPIYRMEENGIMENLLFSLQNDETYKVFLVTYDLDQQEQEDLRNGYYVNIENRFVATQIDGVDLASNVMGKESAKCVWNAAESCFYGNANHPNGHSYNGDECPGFQVTITQYCENGTGGDPGNDESENESNDPPVSDDDNDGTDSNCDTCGANGTTSDTNTDDGEETDMTSPTPDPNSPEYLREKNFIRNQLDADQRAIFNSLTDETQNMIIDYLEAAYLADDSVPDGYPEEAVEFAIAAIEALANGGEVEFQEKIINNLTGKANCVYSKIKQHNGVRKILDKFQEVNSPATLRLNLDSIGEEVAIYGNGAIIGYDRARTDVPDSPQDIDDVVTIYLNNVTSSNNNVSSQPNLLLAQTIYHEILHAEFARQIILAIGAGNYGGATFNEVLTALENGNYTEVYEHFRIYRDWSHNLMANNYLDAIARITQEFDTGIFVPDNIEPDQLYRDLAWRGLEDELRIEAYAELAQEEKDRINNVIQTYLAQNSNETCTE